MHRRHRRVFGEDVLRGLDGGDDLHRVAPVARGLAALGSISCVRVRAAGPAAPRRQRDHPDESAPYPGLLYQYRADVLCASSYGRRLSNRGAQGRLALPDDAAGLGTRALGNHGEHDPHGLVLVRGVLQGHADHDHALAVCAHARANQHPGPRGHRPHGLRPEQGAAAARLLELRLGPDGRASELSGLLQFGHVRALRRRRKGGRLGADRRRGPLGAVRHAPGALHPALPRRLPHHTRGVGPREGGGLRFVRHARQRRIRVRRVDRGHYDFLRIQCRPHVRARGVRPGLHHPAGRARRSRARHDVRGDAEVVALAVQVHARGPRQSHGRGARGADYWCYILWERHGAQGARGERTQGRFMASSHPGLHPRALHRLVRGRDDRRGDLRHRAARRGAPLLRGGPHGRLPAGIRGYECLDARRGTKIRCAAPLTEKLRSLSVDAVEEWVHVADDLDAAVAWAEDMVLALLGGDYTPKAQQLRPRDEVMPAPDLPTPARQLAALMPSLAPKDRDALAKRFAPRRLAAGDALWRQHDASDSIAVLVSGSLLSTLEDEAGTSEVVSAGNMLGETASLTEEPRASTVTAREPAVVYVLDAAALADLRCSQPSLVLELALLSMRYMSHRLEHVSNRIWETRCRMI
mmetsp:Transcript_13035/g.38830  ORF Transcript_13035/g.38830 Transcript_13035/m.38830 type:complete len:637 (-) Transcript_13035:13-1923(-)